MRFLFGFASMFLFILFLGIVAVDCPDEVTIICAAIAYAAGVISEGREKDA